MIPIKYAPKPVVQDQPDNTLAKLAPLAGAAIGAAAGGLPTGGVGAATGASLGMGLGGAAGGFLSKAPEQAVQDPGPAPVGGGDAMSRRLADLDNAPLRQIRSGLDALKGQPPEMIAEYGPPLIKAEQKMRRG